MPTKTRYLIVAMGPGETGHARAMANYIHAQGQEVTLAVQQAINLNFGDIKPGAYPTQLIETPAHLYSALQSLKPTVLVFCNSKAWQKDSEFRNNPPQPKPLTVCLDSNWLFNDTLYPFFSPLGWSDLYLITIPADIYALGLKEQGGGFEIPALMQKKIHTTGFIPSYDPPRDIDRERFRETLQVHPNEKLIFLYASGRGADYRGWIVDNLRRALGRLKPYKQRIKILCIGPLTDQLKALQSEYSVIYQEHLDDFYKTLAVCDLVFQHHGMVTLAQAIAARIPVIANIAVPGYDKLPSIHEWEIGPFDRSGVCRMHRRTDNPALIAESVRQLLFDETSRQQMRQAQDHHFVKGEERAYHSIQGLL